MVTAAAGTGGINRIDSDGQQLTTGSMGRGAFRRFPWPVTAHQGRPPARSGPGCLCSRSSGSVRTLRGAGGPSGGTVKPHGHDDHFVQA